jgi:hypothetical protein
MFGFEKAKEVKEVKIKWFKKQFKKQKIETVNFTKKVVGYESIKETSTYIRDMGRIAFIPKHKRSVVRVETFEEAQTRLGVSDEQIADVKRTYTISFYVSFFFALACLGLTCLYFARSDIIGILSSLSIMCLCLANSFRFSFRAFQIKHRSLCSASVWCNSKQWFPL